MLDQIKLDGWNADDIHAIPVSVPSASRMQSQAAYPGSNGPLYAIEGEDHYRLLFALPALDPTTLTLSANGATITIKGSYYDPALADDENVVLGQVPKGSGWWTMRLPFEITEGQIEATYKHGLLQLNVAKHASMKNVVPIPVKAA